MKIDCATVSQPGVRRSVVSRSYRRGVTRLISPYCAALSPYIHVYILSGLFDLLVINLLFSRTHARA